MLSHVDFLPLHLATGDIVRRFIDHLILYNLVLNSAASKMNSSTTTLEVWQRGPIEGVPLLLQPVAHALLQVAEDVDKEMKSFPSELLWEKPAGMASVGFHIQHISGVIDRLFTYAKGHTLTDNQLKALSSEQVPPNENCTSDNLAGILRMWVERAVAQLVTTDEKSLLEFRGIGRKQIPSNVIGLLFHAAEHSQGHLGQLLVTARILRNLDQSKE
jgi:hypothetical protein